MILSLIASRMWADDLVVSDGGCEGLELGWQSGEKVEERAMRFHVVAAEERTEACYEGDVWSHAVIHSLYLPSGHVLVEYDSHMDWTVGAKVPVPADHFWAYLVL